MRFDPHAVKWMTLAPVALALVSIAPAGVAPAQSSTRSPATSNPAASSSRPYTDPGLPGASGIDMLRGDDPSLHVSRLNARRDDMKKRMEQNADRLLQLTAQLRADLQRGEPTEADSKRLDDIAKLAHAVRDQMRQ